jgi:hypothetical protein
MAFRLPLGNDKSNIQVKEIPGSFDTYQVKALVSALIETIGHCLKPRMNIRSSLILAILIPFNDLLGEVGEVRIRVEILDYASTR